MPAVRDEAICLRHWDWSETSQTVSFFGRSLGLIRGLAKGARRERGAFGGGIDLLTRGEFGAIVKSGLELATLTEWELLETFPALRESLSRNRAAFYAADLVQRMVAPVDPHPGLYDALLALLRALGESRPSADPAHDPAPSSESAEMAMALLRFQWSLLEQTGLQPDVETARAATDRATLWFDPLGGVFSDAAPARGWRVRRATVELLRCLCTTTEEGELASDHTNINDANDYTGGATDGAVERVGAPHTIHADAEAIDRANRLLAAYIRETIQSEPPTLKDLFGNLGVGSFRPAPRSI